MAAVERLPALHYSVDFFSCPLGSWVSLWNFETIRGSLMKPKWQKLASLAQNICTLWFQFFGAVFASKGYPFKNIFGAKTLEIIFISDYQAHGLLLQMLSMAFRTHFH